MDVDLRHHERAVDGQGREPVGEEIVGLEAREPEREDERVLHAAAVLLGGHERPSAPAAALGHGLEAGRKLHDPAEPGLALGNARRALPTAFALRDSDARRGNGGSPGSCQRPPSSSREPRGRCASRARARRLRFARATAGRRPSSRRGHGAAGSRLTNTTPARVFDPGPDETRRLLPRRRSRCLEQGAVRRVRPAVVGTAHVEGLEVPALTVAEQRPRCEQTAKSAASPRSAPRTTIRCSPRSGARTQSPGPREVRLVRDGDPRATRRSPAPRGPARRDPRTPLAAGASPRRRAAARRAARRESRQASVPRRDSTLDLVAQLYLDAERRIAEPFYLRPLRPRPFGRKGDMGSGWLRWSSRLETVSRVRSARSSADSSRGRTWAAKTSHRKDRSRARTAVTQLVSESGADVHPVWARALFRSTRFGGGHPGRSGTR